MAAADAASGGRRLRRSQHSLETLAANCSGQQKREPGVAASALCELAWSRAGQSGAVRLDASTAALGVGKPAPLAYAELADGSAGLLSPRAADPSQRSVAGAGTLPTTAGTCAGPAG